MKKLLIVTLIISFVACKTTKQKAEQAQKENMVEASQDEWQVLFDGTSFDGCMSI